MKHFGDFLFFSVLTVNIFCLPALPSFGDDDGGRARFSRQLRKLDVTSARKIYLSDRVNRRFVPPSRPVTKNQRVNGDFDVTYFGFTETQKAAFQYAVDIWEQTINTSVAIEVNANWSDYGAGGVGYSWPTWICKGYEGMDDSVWYPVALANNIYNDDIISGDNDIDVYINSYYADSFYYGTDGNCPSDKIDFVTVVLKQLCVGLGFDGGLDFNISTGVGSSGEAWVFDLFIYNKDKQNLLNSFSDGSTDLGTQLVTPGNLFFNGIYTDYAQLYSPAVWSSNASVYHLGEQYENTGNALMTPALGWGEAIHTVGSIVPSIFEDMGWSQIYYGPTISTNVDAKTLNIVAEYGYPVEDIDLSIWNGGDYGAINFTISENASWLSCAASSGTAQYGGTPFATTLSVDVAGMSVGTKRTTVLTITDPAATNFPVDITVNLSVVEPISIIKTDISSVINLTASTGVNPDDRTFNVCNTGHGDMAFEISVDKTWLSCSPTVGTSSGEEDKVPVTISFATADLPRDYDDTAVISIIDANASNSPYEITVNLGVTTMPVIALSSTSENWSVSTGATDYEFNIVTEFGLYPNTETFQVYNVSNESVLNYFIKNSQSWFSLTPVKGDSVGDEDRDTVTLKFASAALPLGRYSDIIEVSDVNSVNGVKTIAVNLTVGNADIPTDNLVVGLLSGESQVVTKDEQGKVMFWTDASGEGVNAEQRVTKRQPILLKTIQGASSLYFNGSSGLVLDDSNAVNSQGPYNAKSVVVAFETGDDINSRQMLFEQGDSKSGLNIYMENSQLFFNAWNLKKSSEQKTTWGPLTVSANVSQNSFGTAVLVFDNSDAETAGSASGRLIGYVEGRNVGEVVGAGNLMTTTQSACVGNVDGNTWLPKGGKCGGFKGQLYEFYYYNDKVLTLDEVQSLNSGMLEKYREASSAINDYSMWLSSSKGANLSASGSVESWSDLSFNRLLAKQASSNRQPRLDSYDVVTAGMDGLTGIKFSGNSQYFSVSNSDAVNADRKGYENRHLFLVFRTGDDVDVPQVIWSEGNAQTGLVVYVENREIVMMAWNQKRSAKWGPVYVDGNVEMDSFYQAHLIFDYNANTFDGTLKKLEVDGASVQLGPAEQPIGILPKHTPASIGGNRSSQLLKGGDKVKGCFFQGTIFEIIMYNRALSDAQVVEIDSYLSNLYSPTE